MKNQSSMQWEYTLMSKRCQDEQSKNLQGVQQVSEAPDQMEDA